MFSTQNPMPCISAAIIRFTALLPPPPTPITSMRAVWLGIIPLAEGVLWLIWKGECGDGGRSSRSKEPLEESIIAGGDEGAETPEGVAPLLGGCIMSLEEVSRLLRASTFS